MALGYYTTGSSSSSSRTSGSGRVGGAPGREWKKHRYIRKEGNKYIYPEDLQKQNQTQKRSQSVQATRQQAQQKLARSNAAAANEKYKNRDHDDRVRYAKQEAQRAYKEAQKLNNSPMNKLDDAMKGVGKFFDDTGKSISKGVDDAGKAISKGVNDVGKAVSKAWNDPTGQTAKNKREKILAEAAEASANKRLRDSLYGPNAEKRRSQARKASERAAEARYRAKEDNSVAGIAGREISKGADAAYKGLEKGMKSADQYLRKNVTEKAEKFWNDPTGEGARDRRKAILAEAASAAAARRARAAKGGSNYRKRQDQAYEAANRATSARVRAQYHDYSLPRVVRDSVVDAVESVGKGLDKADKYLNKNVVRKGEKFINDLFGRTPKGQLSKSEKLLRAGEAAARNLNTAERTIRKDISTKPDKEFYNQKAAWRNAYNRKHNLTSKSTKNGIKNFETVNNALDARKNREKRWDANTRKQYEHIIKEEKIFDPIVETHRRAKNNRYTYKRSVDQKIEKNRRKKSK